MLVALAQALVLVAGGMNLSVGAIGGLATITTGYCIQVLGLPGWLAALVALGIGSVAGWVNGVIITRLQINSFIATLATLFVFTGLVHGFSEGYAYTDIPREFTFLGTAEVFGAVEFVLDDGAGAAGDALRIPAHGFRAAAVGDWGESGGGSAGGDQYRPDDFAVACAVGWSGGAGCGVVGFADGVGATGDG